MVDAKALVAETVDVGVRSQTIVAVNVHLNTARVSIPSSTNYAIAMGVPAHVSVTELMELAWPLGVFVNGAGLGGAVA